MPRNATVWTAIAAIGTSCLAGIHAEGPTPPVPDVGAWATYYVVHRDAQDAERNFTLTVRYVDRVTEGGVACRWVEFEAVPTKAEDMQRFHNTWKLLIPESSLTTDSNPVRRGVRAWARTGDMPADRLDLLFEGHAFEIADIYVGPYLLFLPGARTAAATIAEPRTVEYQRGQLRCESAQKGEYKSGYHSTVDYHLDWRADYSVWLAQDVPCGFASAKFKWSMKVVGDDNEVRRSANRHSEELWLLDFGTGAKTALPDCN